MQSILFSIQAKGFQQYLQRGQAIINNYSLTPAKLVHALDQFSQILGEFECEATFPITAIVVERNSKYLAKYVARGIEFAIHGYRHIDHTQLELEEQLLYLRYAKHIFASAGIPVTGFRAPYLRFNQSSAKAAREAGLEYVSNQPIIWKVLQNETLLCSAQQAYARAIALYNPWSDCEGVSLPQVSNHLVHIPISLPDDEMLSDRLGGVSNGLMTRAWFRMLDETYQRQELLTLLLHPERINQCAQSLRALLTKAFSFDPPVWITRLDKLANWWRAWSQATIEVNSSNDNEVSLNVSGVEDMALLVRNIDVPDSHPWIKGYKIVKAQQIRMKTQVRPFIGVPTATPSDWQVFFRENGYIVEASNHPQEYSIYLNWPQSFLEDRRLILNQIEESNCPLVKLGRWPHGSCSALAITGDIDALTLWDYGLRFIGR